MATAMPTATPTRMLMRLRKLTLRSQDRGELPPRRRPPKGSLSGGAFSGPVRPVGTAHSSNPFPVVVSSGSAGAWPGATGAGAA